MSVVVPPSIPSAASAGEKIVHKLLQSLPPGCVSYYEPNIDGRRPDFLIVCPSLGLLVVEVKGWYPKHIHSGTLKKISYQRDNLTSVETHPEEQARGYVLRLLGEMKRPLLAPYLLHLKGEYEGKPRFPIGRVSILSNMSDAQLDEPRPGCGNLRDIFPRKHNISRDDLQHWSSLSPEELLAQFANFFDPFWPISQMIESEITALRGLVHPEIFFDESQNPEIVEDPPVLVSEGRAVLKALDLQQEGFASGIGSGHRIIHGVAGSGKTLILLARAKAVVTQNPGSRVLLTCYNRTLAAWLRFQLEGFPGVTVLNIHRWASRNGVPFRTDDPAIAKILLESLNAGSRDSAAFDTILVDEAQDLDPSFFPCLLAAMKDPEDGDLVIVADGSQSLYRRANFTWAQYGIKARGRTVSTRFNLERNYRNSKEICLLASTFLTASEADAGVDNAIQSLRVEPAQSVITTGAKPLLITAKDRRGELNEAAKIVRDLIDGVWQNQQIIPLKPEEIGIFYPSSRENEKALLAEFVAYLGNRGIPATWLNDPKNPGSAEDITTTGVKLQTAHSAKGLQYRAAILVWADKLPKFDSYRDPEQRRTDRRLFYVAITRAESFFAIIHSEPSDFLEDIAQSSVATTMHRICKPLGKGLALAR